MTKEQLFEFVRAKKYAVLSSVNEKGQPESAVVGIAVTPDLEIVFDTLKTSRKYGNLKMNPAAAFVVGCGDDEKTLQYEGVACEAEGEELRRLKQVYFSQFPNGPSRESWPDICYFVLRPQWLRFSDYGETPARIEEFKY